MYIYSYMYVFIFFTFVFTPVVNMDELYKQMYCIIICNIQ